MWGDDSDSYGSGSSSDPIVVGGDSALQLGSMRKKNKWQSFLGGMQGPQGQGGGGIAGGLKGLAGSGGVGGAIGNVAKFLL